MPLHVQILAGMALGLAAGLLLGKDASPLGEIGRLVIQLVKVVAGPLLFFAIVSAILKAEVGMRGGLRMIGVASFNALLALLIGLSLSNLLQPGKHLDWNHTARHAAPSVAAAAPKLTFLATLESYIPKSVVQPFAENMILTLVVLALLLGFGLKRVRTPETKPLEAGAHAMFDVMGVVLGWVIRLIPFAVFGVVAKASGEHGLAPLRGLGVYVVVGVAGLAIQVLVVYQSWIVLFARMSLGKFWREARDAVVYSVGANSSLATLPLTLQALDRMGVSKSASTLGACVGTNLNNDGIILYEAMAVLFVAQAQGFDLTLGQQLAAAATCLVAAMGVAGVPEAGFISLTLVVATVGLPAEVLPLLLTVDWIVARARSVTNVLSDMTVSIALDRLERAGSR